MKLKEKFAKATNKGSYYVIPIIEDAEIIEKIADEFAIEFAEWVIGGKIGKKYLEIYKKEKGL